MLLYIPFWLYSNFYVLVTIGHYIIFTFHSGYILIEKCIGILKADYTLYIPFWLYSNAVICLNLIYTTVFTFHSGYILIVGFFAAGASVSAFTFHSGYILIKGPLYIAFVKPTLHSILVIF